MDEEVMNADVITVNSDTSTERTTKSPKKKKRNTRRRENEEEQATRKNKYMRQEKRGDAHINIIPQDEQYMIQLTKDIQQFYRENVMTAREELDCENCRLFLEDIVHKTLGTKHNVFMFGSVKSKLASRTSDVDICIDGIDPKETKAAQALIAKYLKRETNAKSINVISWARIPLIKLYLPAFRKEVDLTFKATFGAPNSALLRCYTQLESRVRPLLFSIKAWVKANNMGDGSMGFPTSYAWMLMAIYYLQRVSPPVLPCLQTDAKPVLFNGRNIAFNDSHMDGKSYNTSLNQQSESDLFLGFLCFYTHVFDWYTEVVSIRTGKSLSLSDWARNVRQNAVVEGISFPENIDQLLLGTEVKLRSEFDLSGILKNEMCVEDPFELRNLTKGVNIGHVHQVRDTIRETFEALLAGASFQAIMTKKEIIKKSKKKFLPTPRSSKDTPLTLPTPSPAVMQAA